MPTPAIAPNAAKSNEGAGPRFPESHRAEYRDRQRPGTRSPRSGPRAMAWASLFPATAATSSAGARLTPSTLPNARQERLCGLGADARDRREARSSGCAARFARCALDAEPVRLVPDPLKQLERRRRAIQPHRLALSLKEDLFLPLCAKTTIGSVGSPSAAAARTAAPSWPAPPSIRTRSGKRRFLREDAPVTAGDRLGDRREVIGATDRS